MATDASPAETIEIGNRNKLGCKGKPQPMPKLKPTANANTTTNTNCGSQHELTGYSIQHICDDSGSLVHVRQIDATSPFQIANNGARCIH